MATEHTPGIGSDIGPYRIEAVLGRGGMGVVYRALDSRLGRSVALKVLPPEYGDDVTFRSRFLRESRIAASIDHPNVIPVFEAGDAAGQLYIAMRYVEGTDLADLLRRGGPLEPERAMGLVRQLAGALDAAHARGLVHRDIKPSNALVTGPAGAEHLYLSDFGLSKEAAGDATASASGAVVGTVKYMAPETIRGEPADARSDLYSLGCVLFECLTGEPPFPGPTEAAVIYAHLEEPPPRVSERRPGLPRALDAVVARALHKDPARRWPSAAELVEAAAAAVEGSGPMPRARDVAGRRALVGVAAVLALAGAATAAALLGSRDGPGIAAVEPNAVAVIDPDGGSLEDQVALDEAPAGLASGAGAVWVTHEDRGVLTRVDTGTRTIRQTIRVGRGPSALAVLDDRVWVANRQDGSVSVVSEETNEVVQTIPVGRSVDGLCVAAGAVWVASPLDYVVVRLDPTSGRKTRAVRLDVQPTQLACTGAGIWASSPTSGVVTEIDPAAAAAVRSIQVGRGASALAAGPAGLWVTNAAEGTVSRIDPRRGAVTATVAVGASDGPAHLAVGEDAVWVSSEFGGTLARVDPGRGQVAEKIRVGNRPQALALLDGALWLGVADTGRRHRGGTLRLEFPDEGSWEDMDPATGYGFQTISATNDGLTAFRRQAGVAGTALVANLAEALPVASDGGRTYSFRLRHGILYSSGEPLRASHVRFSLERTLRNNPYAGELYGSIRGADRCTPERCDLDRGILVDDATRSVVLRLARPDPDLLHKLALPFASILPPSVGAAAPAKRPLPATGPYRVTRFDPGRSLRLERNPRFRSWSAIARPEGYPDAITARFGAEGVKTVDRVVAGEIDFVSNIAERVPGRLASLRRQAPAQMRESLAFMTFYFILNTRVAPFDETAARRAVAFAVDRSAAVAAAGGKDVARETCQILPPGFPGSRPYCPYTLSGSGGAAGRPDVARARRLVERSGTRGMRVTVLTPDLVTPDVAKVMARSLRRIGYDARVRVLPLGEHFSAVNDTSKRTQIGMFPWIADYPAPSTFLDPFKCDALTPNSVQNVNPSQFCDREVDRLMGEAGRLQASDPGAADALWARAERRIIDAAPAVPLYNLVNVDLISERVGNYQYSPVYGMLYDQVWLR